MKRCPECRRDYFDDSLLYCLDDGARLLDGPRLPFQSEDELTANLADASTVVDADLIATRAIDPSAGKESEPTATSRRPSWMLPAVVLGILLVGGLALAGVYWPRSQPSVDKKAVSKAAYDNYMRAKVLGGSQNRDDNAAAIKLLEDAVNQEPQYAAAWAMLAQAYSLKAFYFASPDERKPLNDNAQVAVEKALAIDPNLADAHLARGVLLWTHVSRFQHEPAIQSIKRAIELDPKSDEAHHQLALVYFHIGLFDKAEAEIAKALELNPANSLARYRYAVIDMYRGKYDDAYAISQSTPLDKTPSLQASQGAMILFRLGRMDEAERTVDAYLTKYPQDEGGIATSVKAMILVKRGRVDDALTAVRRAEELGQDFGHFHHTAYNIACVYAMLGKPDKAVDNLQLAADDGFPCYPLFERDELLKGISHDPRFTALLARLKQQWDRYNATL